MELITFFCIAACLLALYWRVYRRQGALTCDIPGPPGLPIIGNAHLFMGKLTENLPVLMKLFQDYGPLVKLYIGSRVYILMKDPDDIQVILGNPKIRHRDNMITKVLGQIGGYGLFSLRGDQWQLHRKLITPTFHFKILDCFVEVFGRKSAILVEKFKQLEGKAFDVYPLLSLCTLDAICETAIGTAVNCQAAGQSKMVDAVRLSMIYIHSRVVRPWLLVDFIHALSWNSRQSKAVTKTLHAFSETVIAQKLSEYRRGIRSPGITTASNKRVTSFLDMLIEASETQGSILSPEEMRDEVTTMAIAGLDTTANTMSFLLVLVAMDSKVQAEIHKELDQVFGYDDRAATPEDLQRLPVLERCIKETMRLFPAAPAIPREIDEDQRLPSGYTLPAGSSTLILSYATHRDPRYFPDPEEFRPDRWLPENLKASHPYAYIPFSAGARNCIGQKYAQLQMKSITSQVLRRFRVSTELTRKDLVNLELALILSLDQEQEGRYRIRLHER